MNKHAIFIFFVLLAIPAGLMDIHLIGIHFTLISLPPLLAASFLVNTEESWSQSLEV